MASGSSQVLSPIVGSRRSSRPSRLTGSVVSLESPKPKEKMLDREDKARKDAKKKEKKKDNG